MTNLLPAGPVLTKSKQFIKLFANPVPFLMDCHKKYGDIFTLNLLGNKTFVVISNPDAIREVFQANPEKLLTGKPNGDVLKTTLGYNSLLTLDGKKHFQHRKILSFPFHGGRMHAYAEIMRQEADKAISKMPDNTEISLLPYMHEITLGVILRAVFGVEDQQRFNDLAKKLSKLLHFIKSKIGLLTMLIPAMHVNLGRFSPWGRLQFILKEVNTALYEEINRRKEMADLENFDDVLSLLLQATYEDGTKLSDLELRDEMLTMLNAGHETTATSLAWAMYRIHSNPEVLENILQEINAVVGQGEIKQEHVAKLEYLDAVVKETLRLLPIISFVVRELQEPMHIDGYDLPAGVTVVPCIQIAHHRQDFWPDPETFKPERFLNSNISPYNFLPFGGGVRRCLGSGMALYEMKIVLAQMLRKKSFALISGYKPKHMRHGVVIGPSKGMPMLIKQKNN